MENNLGSTHGRRWAKIRLASLMNQSQYVLFALSNCEGLSQVKNNGISLKITTLDVMKIDTLKEMLSISETSKHAIIWTIFTDVKPWQQRG